MSNTHPSNVAYVLINTGEALIITQKGERYIVECATGCVPRLATNVTLSSYFTDENILVMDAGNYPFKEFGQQLQGLFAAHHVIALIHLGMKQDLPMELRLELAHDIEKLLQEKSIEEAVYQAINAEYFPDMMSPVPFKEGTKAKAIIDAASEKLDRELSTTTE